MPPKGKKGKAGKKKSKSKDEITRPSEKEAILQAELDKKVRELAEIKLRVQRAQEENVWLTDQASRVQIEMHEYKHFMTKKANVRYTQVVTLNDYHRQEIENIHRDKENMFQEYQQRKQELRSQILQKEQLLKDAKHELEAMNEYKVIQENQNDEIQRLQHEITQIRAEHVNGIARLKLKCEREIEQQRAQEDAEVDQVREQANRAAEQFRANRTVDIQNDNVYLRKSLQEILRRTGQLNQTKQELEEEQLHLIRRLKLTADLRKIRSDKLSATIKEK